MTLYSCSIDGVAHQFSLSFGLTSYVLSAARQTLISANKEGLVSITGMCPLFFFLFLTAFMLIPVIRLSRDTPPRPVDGDIYNTSLTFLFPPATAGCRSGTPQQRRRRTRPLPHKHYPTSGVYARPPRE